MKNILTLFIFLLIGFNSLFGQFGQNRVQYKEHDWYYIQTKHYDIYFTSEGKMIAEFASTIVEEALEQLQKDFNYQINNRMSLIVYNSHNDFIETNTSDSRISQGIGGFTEPLKNRVVLPFEGNYAKFEHVIRHELVHQVMMDLLYGGTLQNIISKNITLTLPGWYHEGMAEFLSSGWETYTDTFVRDQNITESMPDIMQMSGYLGYRDGQALFHYIAETYGREKVGEILNNIKSYGNLEEGFKASIGLTLEELNEKWKKELKKEYWPEIAYRDDPDVFSKRLTDRKKDGGFYNTSPAISPQGDKVAFISDRDIFLDVYVMNTLDDKSTKRIVESGRTNDFEELNILFPSLTWSPDNNRVALSLKSSGYDRITIIDVEEEKSNELPFGMDGIESVAWSPDGTKIAFSGSDPTQSDIYIYDLENEKILKVTDDIFTDLDPSWFPDSKKIVFASDRKEYISNDMLEEDFHILNHNIGSLDLYSVDLETKVIERLTDFPLSDESMAVVSPKGDEILFVSDLNGIDNIYKKRITITEEDSVGTIVELPSKPITNSISQLTQLSLSKDGKKLVFTSLYKTGYDIFQINNPFDIDLKIDRLAPTNYMTSLIENYGQDFDTTEVGNQINTFDESEIISADSGNEIETIEPDSVKISDEVDIFTGQFVQDDTPDTISVESDYSKYIFGMNDSGTDSTFAAIRTTVNFKENLDTSGNFLVNRYKVDFSPDLIYANAGYSSLYGLLGTTVLSFSDVLGNHRLIGVTSMQIDLKNSDYGLAYYYLPERIDWGFEFFHTARFVYLSAGYYSELYRFRNLGAVVSASYPLDRFHRVDASLSLLRVSGENLDNYNIEPEETTYLIPSLSFVKDNTIWGYTSPIEGTRYNATLFGNPGIGSSSRSFYSITWDARKYYRFWYDNSFVWRISGGYSGGANPQRFFIGGTSNWINREFATGDIPLENASDFAFLSPAMPLRGYDYAEQIGTRYSLLNLELRMPLIRYLLTGPLPIFFQNILGTAFIDAGSAWNDNRELQLFTKNSDGKTVTKDLLIGTGFGARLYLLFLWRLDVAWSFDWDKFSSPRYYFSIGLDF